MTTEDYKFNLTTQISPHGRATCRECKAKVQKDAIRIGFCFQSGSLESCPWHHLQCFYLPNCKTSQELKINDIKNLDKLDQGQRSQVQTRILKLQTGEITRPPKKRKLKPQDITPENGKRYKKGGYTEQQRKMFQDCKKQYCTYSLKELQQMLERNHQKKTGTKEQVLERVADCKVLGSIPRCADCPYGRLHFNRFNGTYKCIGFYNIQYGYYEKLCTSKFSRKEVTRKPFY